MRFLIEIFVVAGLLYLGWEKPFKEWTGQKSAPAPLTAAPSPALQVAPLPSGPAWMTDPSHRGTLDRPVQAASAPQQKPSSGSWRLDPNHRSPLDPAHNAGTPH